jgi:hypothetical protein
MKRHLSLLLPLLVSLAMTVLSIHAQHGGVLHPEMEARLSYQLSDKPLTHKLYDSEKLDQGMYQARELSYFFDYLDCQFFAWCIRLGHPHFLSITYYIFMTVISLMIWHIAVGQLRLDRWLALAVLLLLWTTPAVFLGGVLFRTAKIGVALVEVVLFWLLFRILRRGMDDPRSTFPIKSWLACFCWAWAATLFDRQGVYLVGTILVFLVFWFFAYRQKSTLDIIGAFIAALALSFLYNHMIDPVLTLWLNGYWPDFRYQHLPWNALAERPTDFAAAGLSLYLDTVRFSFGNVPTWAALVVIAGLIALALVAGRRQGAPFFKAATGFIVTQTILVWAMLTLMVLRHGALLWPDVRRGYYLLPTVAMFTVALPLAIQRIQNGFAVPKWAIALPLAAAIGGNIIALPQHRLIVTTGHMKQYFESAPAFLKALRNVRNSDYVAPPDIADSSVYRIFRPARQ